MSTDDDLIRRSAAEVVGLLRDEQVSPLELIDASVRRIEAVDKHINALPILCVERAREQAQRLMADAGRAREARSRPGWLGGLPIAVKDYNDVSGVRTTHGSPLFAESVAERSDYTVETLEGNGAVPLAKSNVPEFAGTHTFNPVFGATLNPWDTTRSAGGSSGGAAAALATGMAWLATGSDLGGSVRTPASFCSVVGLRPSPGRIARGPGPMPFDPLWVQGPMGRTVGDVAMMFDAQVGLHTGDPLSFPAPAEPFAEAARRRTPPTRVAFSPDLGIISVDPEVAEICAAATRRFEDSAARVDEACPDFSGSSETFHALRALMFATMKGSLLDEHRDEIAPEIVWNIEQGHRISSDTLVRAERTRGEIFERVERFFGDYDVLACPAAIVPPFPVEDRYVEEVGGQRLPTYIDWIANAFAITLTSCPAISVPCGFTRSGLPVGLQLVGRPRGEAALLAAAQLLEDSLAVSEVLPIDPRIGEV